MNPHPAAADPDPLGTSGVDEAEHTFTAELWQWDARRQDTWTFVTVPLDISAAIEQVADIRGPRSGFGSVRVHVRIGPSSWDTSVFPDSASGQFVLPVKRQVRDANEVDVGDMVTVHLRVA
jgi:hypothetical protein